MMAEVSRSVSGDATALPLASGLEEAAYRAAAASEGAPESSTGARVGWGFIGLYTLAFISTSLLFLAPLLVTLALKVNSLVGLDRAPKSLALVAGWAAFWRCSRIRSSEG